MDTVDRQTRSRIMASVRSANTGLEQRFVALLTESGIEGFVVHPKGIEGNPDIVFHAQRVAVFVDGCFWHGCPKHLRRPNSNQEYWTQKIDGNVRRDRRKRSRLRREGWSVLRLWEHDLQTPRTCVKRVMRALAKRTSEYGLPDDTTMLRVAEDG